MAKDKLVTLLSEQKTEIKAINTTSSRTMSLTKDILASSKKSLLSEKSMIKEMRATNKHLKYKLGESFDKSNNKLGKNINKGFGKSLKGLDKSLTKTLEKSSRHSNNLIGKVAGGITLMGTTLLGMPSMMGTAFMKSGSFIVSGLSKVFLGFPKMIAMGIKNSMGFITKAIMKSQAMRGAGSLLGGALGGIKGGAGGIGGAFTKLAGAVSNIHPAMKALFVAGVGISGYIGYRKYKEAKINKSIENNLKQSRRLEKKMHAIDLKNRAKARLQDTSGKFTSNYNIGRGVSSKTSKQAKREASRDMIGESLSSSLVDTTYTKGAEYMSEEHVVGMNKQQNSAKRLFITHVKGLLGSDPDSVNKKTIGDLFDKAVKNTKDFDSDSKKVFIRYKKKYVDTVIKEVRTNKDKFAKMGDKEFIKNAIKVYAKSKELITTTSKQFSKTINTQDKKTKLVDTALQGLEKSKTVFTGKGEDISGKLVSSHMRTLLRSIVELSKTFVGNFDTDMKKVQPYLTHYLDDKNFSNKDASIIISTSRKFVKKLSNKVQVIKEKQLFKRVKDFGVKEYTQKAKLKLDKFLLNITTKQIKPNVKIDKQFKTKIKGMTLKSFSTPNIDTSDKAIRKFMSNLFDKMRSQPSKVGLTVESTLANYQEDYEEWFKFIIVSDGVFYGENFIKIAKIYKSFAQELTDIKLGLYTNKSSGVLTSKKTMFSTMGRSKITPSAGKGKSVSEDYSETVRKIKPSGSRQFKSAGGGQYVQGGTDKEIAYSNKETSAYNKTLSKVSKQIAQDNKLVSKKSKSNPNLRLATPEETNSIIKESLMMGAGVNNQTGLEKINSKYNKNIKPAPKQDSTPNTNNTTSVKNNKTVINKSAPNVYNVINNGQGHNGVVFI